MDLLPLQGMKLTQLDLTWCEKVTDLTPLKGMPLTTLILQMTPVSDLAPLKGTKLGRLDLGNCASVTNVTPLGGLNLEYIRLDPQRIARGMEVLRKMNSLKTIDVSGKDYPAAEFWKRHGDGEFNK
jgi:hypothetical protein